jgi:D-3-phosphoglycerate dehydrogenase
MITKKELYLMKKGSFLINTSRGNVINIPDLAEALLNHLGGAAIDVYPDEPLSNTTQWSSELQKFSNVILTPHIGGATEEAQENIGKDVAMKILNI